MKKVIHFAAGMILLLTGYLLLAGSTDTIKRQRAVLREGPGSFFPAVAELSQGVSVEIREKSDGWYQVTVDEYSGYISGKAFQGERQKTDVLSRMGQQPSVTEVSRSGVSAAVKGFAERFATRLQGDDSLLEMFYSYSIDVEEYRQFKRKTYRNRNLSEIRRRVELPEQDVPDVFSFSEEGVGIAIASKIAGMGLYENQSIRNYVSHVGYLVVEASGSYDIPFKFFILNTEKVNAYSCPGGIIFVTKGALQRMENEAELACFLGHEIAHVALRHGMQELEKRRPMVTADNAFMELSNEIEMTEERQGLNEELESMALDIYETIFEGRLKAYEDEADIFGMTYAARAGYRPLALANYLTKLSSRGYLSGNQHYTPSQNAERLQKVKGWLQKNRFPQQLFVTNAQRFQQFIGTL